MNDIHAKKLATALYNKLFSRKPDKGGLANAITHIKAGNFDFLLGDMVESTEFKVTHQKTVTKTKTVRDPKDVAKIAELSKALEILQKNPGSPVDAADASKWRQFLSLLPFVKK